jgi:hypothetical protein
MRYMLMMVGTPDGSAGTDADLDETERWHADLERRDMGGPASRLAESATTVRIRAGQTLVTDGPFAEAHEQIAGFGVIEAGSMDEAVAIAARHPAARLGRIDVRPLVRD